MGDTTDASPTTQGVRPVSSWLHGMARPVQFGNLGVKGGQRMESQATELHETGSGSSAQPSRPSLSILILNFRKAAATIRCLESLEHCTYSGVKDVLVLENGSGDGSWA